MVAVVSGSGLGLFGSSVSALGGIGAYMGIKGMNAYSANYQNYLQQCSAVGIPCSICGDAPALYPDTVESFVRWGISSISVNVDAAEQTSRAIVRAEQRLLLELARSIINN